MRKCLFALSTLELMFKIREIKTKAEQSETMAQEICHDIKKLDFAKKSYHNHNCCTSSSYHARESFPILQVPLEMSTMAVVLFLFTGQRGKNSSREISEVVTNRDGEEKD